MTKNIQYVVITFWSTQEHIVELITPNKLAARQFFDALRFSLLVMDGYDVTFENIEGCWQSYLEAPHDRLLASLLTYEPEEVQDV